MADSFLDLSELSPEATPYAVEEDSNPLEQNVKMSGLSAYVQKCYTRSEAWRRTDERRWLQAYTHFRGIYGSDVQFRDDEKSRAFIKITKTKVLAAYGQITEVLFSGQEFPIKIEASKNPIGIESEVFLDPSQPQQPARGVSATVARPELMLGPLEDDLEGLNIKKGTSPSPQAPMAEPAKDAAYNMHKRIQDQLSESRAARHLRATVFESCLFGTGILKGPFVERKEYPNWNVDTGAYEPLYMFVPRVTNVPIWHFYPDPDAKAFDDMSWCIEEHRMSKSQLRGLKRKPGFRKESINEAIEQGPSYEEEYWEDKLKDNENEVQNERYRVLEFWGTVDREELENDNVEIPSYFEDYEEIPVNIWICNNQILRVQMNPFTPARIPYQIIPYEVNPYSFFGIGVAENMADSQTLMNGFFRLAVDNAVISSNVMLDVDESMLVSGQDFTVKTGKVWRRQGGAPGQSVFGIKLPNITNECLQLYDKARQLADESTGMPSYAHGQSGITGIGRTAAGMSMLMGAAAQNIKSVVLNIDDYLLGPLGQAMFAFNMQYAFDKSIKGDLSIVPTGTRSLMRTELRSQRLMQFLQMTANPLDAPFTRRDYLIKELAMSLDLDPEKAVNNPLQAQAFAQRMAPALAAAGQQGTPPRSDPTGRGGEAVPGAPVEPGTEGFSGNVQTGQGGASSSDSVNL